MVCHYITFNPTIETIKIEANIIRDSHYSITDIITDGRCKCFGNIFPSTMKLKFHGYPGARVYKRTRQPTARELAYCAPCDHEYHIPLPEEYRERLLFLCPWTRSFACKHNGVSTPKICQLWAEYEPTLTFTYVNGRGCSVGSIGRWLKTGKFGEACTLFHATYPRPRVCSCENRWNITDSTSIEIWQTAQAS